MSRVDELDSRVRAPHKKSVEMAAVQTEERAHAQLIQTLCQEVTAQQLAALGLLEFYAVGRHVLGLWCV